MSRLVLPCLLVSCLLLGCGKGKRTDDGERPTGPPWFADVTAELGVKAVHDAGPTGKHLMPQCVGSGAALYDLDGDGRLDLYLLNNGGPQGKKNQLWRQRDDGTFEDVSAGSGLDFSGFCMGVAIGDFDNDGRPDVLVTLTSGVRLFRNLGGMRFRDVTDEAGLKNPQWSASAAFVDVDGDGWLDLVIVNYVDYDPTWPCPRPSGQPDFCSPKVFRGTASRLFRNRGVGKDGKATFEDVTVSSGLGGRPAPGLGIVCADFAGNGRQDLFIANDGEANHLWVNQGKGVFKEDAASRGVACTAMGQTLAGMGVAVGDVDNDGLLDLYVTHLTGETNTLWKQGPRGLFRDRTVDWALTRTRWRGTGFGTVLADFDNDGRLDLALVNGRVQRGGKEDGSELPEFWRTYGERNQLLANTGKAFEDRSLNDPALCGYANVGRGLCVGDVDGDGGLDLVVTSIAGPVRILRNVAPRRGHWLAVRAVDPRLKRDALGAQITVRAGERSWLRLVASAFSYLCACPAEAHFGLGDVDRIEKIEVTWPDGQRETFPGGAVDRRLVLPRGGGKP